MSKTKLSELTEITQIASDDYFPVLDTSDTSQGSDGSTRKIKNFNIIQGSQIATPTGSNDHTQINSLISLINARGGGKLFLKSGTYVCGEIDPCSNLEIEGEDESTIIQKKANTNVNQFNLLSVDGFTMRRITIDGNKSNESGLSGKCINIGSDSKNLYFENLYIHDGIKHGIYADTATNHINITIDKCRIENMGTSSDGSGIYLGNVIGAKISNVISGGHTLDGLQWDTSCDKFEIVNYRGFNNNRYGLYSKGGKFLISNSFIYSNDSNGVQVDGVGSMKATNMDVYENGNDGIRIESSDGSDLKSIHSYNNGVTSTSAGLRLRAVNAGETCNRHIIIGCSFYDTQGVSATQEYGILATGSGSVDYNVVIGNQLYGNKTSQFQQDTWGGNNIYSTSDNILS